MFGMKSLVASMSLGVLLTAATASMVGAEPGQNGTDQNHNKQNVNVAATPELDSVLLLGGGLIGVAGYAALRVRARRR